MQRRLEGAILILCLGLALAAPGHRARASAEDFSFGGFAMDQLGQAYDEFNRASEICKQRDREIGVAREEYRRALASGQGVEEARSRFHFLLDSKDFIYMIADVIGGKDTPQAKVVKQTCALDGGINPLLRSLFDDLVSDLRFTMGAKRRDDLVLLNPIKLERAIEANQPKARLYLRARNLLEILGSGIPGEKLVSPETYAQMLLEYQFVVREKPEVIPPNAERIGEEWYALLVRELGAEVVNGAAETVLKLPKTGWGGLAQPFEIVDPPPEGRKETSDPLAAFQGILKASSPRAYVIFAKGGELPAYWPVRVERGVAFYDGLVSKYGEAEVAAAAQQVFAAPKHGEEILEPQRGGFQKRKPSWWMEKLLSDPSARIPEAGGGGAGFLAASDTEGIRSAKEQFQVVYGRVNDVLWSEGGRTRTDGDIDYFFVYFAGSKDFAARVRIYPVHDFFREHGADAQGLIGKLVRVEQVIHPRYPADTNPISPNFSMSVREDEIAVIREDEWPDALPIPAMEPARSKAQLAADQTPALPVDPPK